MGNFFTYEVMTFDVSGELDEVRTFNTHLESKCYYEIVRERAEDKRIQHVKIINGNEREILREAE
jgi:hypothetical protein